MKGTIAWSPIHWIPDLSGKVQLVALPIGSLGKDLGSYGIPFPADLGRSVDKRQRQYLAGRLCAQEACRRTLGVASVVGRDDRGRPLWPSGCLGSITHTDSWALAVATPAFCCQGIGIDSERMQQKPEVVEAIRGLAFTAAERELLRTPAETFLGFSMKEALYKCQSPVHDWILDFKDVEISQLDHKTGRADLRVIDSAVSFKGAFAIDHENAHVHTAVLQTL